MGFEMLHHSGKLFKDSTIKLDLRNSTENAHRKIFWRQGNSKPVLSKLDKKSNFHVVYIFIDYVQSLCFSVSCSRCAMYIVCPLLLCQISGKKKTVLKFIMFQMSLCLQTTKRYITNPLIKLCLQQVLFDCKRSFSVKLCYVGILEYVFLWNHRQFCKCAYAIIQKLVLLGKSWSAVMDKTLVLQMHWVTDAIGFDIRTGYYPFNSLQMFTHKSLKSWEFELISSF